MILENDWLTTNVLDFKSNKKILAEYVPGDFEESSFMDAATKIANTIKNKYEHIYVTYTGGQDSEFCFNILHEVGANPIPINVRSYATAPELEPGLENLTKKGVEPLIIDLPYNFINIYDSFIKSKFSYVDGFASIFPILVAVEEMKKIHSSAILITGLNLIHRLHNFWCYPRVAMLSNHFYFDLLDVDFPIINMLYYNQHIVYETFRYIMGVNGKNLHTPSNIIKSNLYGTKNREKIGGLFNHLTQEHKDVIKNFKIEPLMPIHGINLRKKGSDDVCEPLAKIWRNLKS